MIMEDKFYRYARYFSALADENRTKIVGMLVNNSEMSASEILKELRISQPTLSHHMKLLVDSGLISAKRIGRSVFYTIDEQVRGDILDAYIDLTVGDNEKAEEMRRKIKRKDNIVLL